MEDPEDPASFVVLDTATGNVVRHDAANITAALTLEGTPQAEQYNTEFELIYANAAPWTVEAAEAECGVPAADIQRIAREYATAEHAMIVHNMGGFMRTENGTYAVAVGAYLQRSADRSAMRVRAIRMRVVCAK